MDELLADGSLMGTIILKFYFLYQPQFPPPFFVPISSSNSFLTAPSHVHSSSLSIQMA